MSENNSTEVFRPVAGWPLYEVSNMGRVRRKYTPGKNKTDPNNFVWRDVRPLFWTDGYARVQLSIGKARKVRTVHHLVLEAFVGPCPEGCEARHVLTNNRADNRLENLAWGTRSENARDKTAHGTALYGERNHRAKLKAEDIDDMRALRDSGVSRDEIAARYGVAPTHVSKVLLGSLWSHLAPTTEARAKLRSRGYVRGGKHHLAKLTEEVVREMRRLHASGMSGTEIARRFGVHKTTACRAIRGSTWSA